MRKTIEIVNGQNDTVLERHKKYTMIGEIEANTISVRATPYGKIDRYGDVLKPSFFQPVLKRFLVVGFVAMAHDWLEPIGMPISAKDSPTELISVGEFHTTQKAQDARTIAMERQERGLETGVSVAFTCKPGGYAMFQNGTALIDFMKGAEMDLAGYDVKAIKAWATYCRLLVDCEELFEWSIALVPVNPGASVLSAKSQQFDGEPPAGSTLEEQLIISLAGIEVANARLRGYTALKSSEQRAVSAARIGQARGLSAELLELVKTMEGMKAKKKDAADDDEDDEELDVEEAAAAKVKALVQRSARLRTEVNTLRMEKIL